MAQHLSSLATITLFSLMMSLGINVNFQEITSLWKDKKLLANSIIAADILVPLVGLFLVLFIEDLPPEVKLGILLMAACPGAPMIARKSVKAGSKLSFSLSLQSTIALFTVISTPITMAFLSKIFDVAMSINMASVGKQIFMGQLLPIAVGVLLNEKKPSIANKIREPLTKIANVLFAILSIIVLIIAFKLLIKTNFISFIAMGIMAIASLGIGHFFGGTDLETRQSLAIACASRNAGLALFVGIFNFPYPELKPYLMSTVICYSLIAAIMTIPYLKWVKSNQKEVSEKGVSQD